MCECKCCCKKVHSRFDFYQDTSANKIIAILSVIASILAFIFLPPLLAGIITISLVFAYLHMISGLPPPM